jgi:hypothetical protein
MNIWDQTDGIPDLLSSTDLPEVTDDFNIAGSSYFRLPWGDLQSSGDSIEDGFWNISFEIDKTYVEINRVDDPSTGAQGRYFYGRVMSVERVGDGTFPNIRDGDEIFGTYRLDLETPESTQSSSDPNFGFFPSAVTDVVINAGPYRFYNSRPDELSVRNNDSDHRGTFDLYGIYMFENAEPNIDNWVLQSFVFQLFDPTASAFNTDQMPRSTPFPDDFVSPESVIRLVFDDPVTGGFFTVDAVIEEHSW